MKLLIKDISDNDTFNGVGVLNKNEGKSEINNFDPKTNIVFWSTKSTSFAKACYFLSNKGFFNNVISTMTIDEVNKHTFYFSDFENERYGGLTFNIQEHLKSLNYQNEETIYLTILAYASDNLSSYHQYYVYLDSSQNEQLSKLDNNIFNGLINTTKNKSFNPSNMGTGIWATHIVPIIYQNDTYNKLHVEIVVIPQGVSFSGITSNRCAYENKWDLLKQYNSYHVVRTYDLTEIQSYANKPAYLLQDEELDNYFNNLDSKPKIVLFKITPTLEKTDPPVKPTSTNVHILNNNTKIEVTGDKTIGSIITITPNITNGYKLTSLKIYRCNNGITDYTKGTLIANVLNTLKYQIVQDDIGKNLIIVPTTEKLKGQYKLIGLNDSTISITPSVFYVNDNFTITGKSTNPFYTLKDNSLKLYEYPRDTDPDTITADNLDQQYLSKNTFDVPASFQCGENLNVFVLEPSLIKINITNKVEGIKYKINIPNLDITADENYTISSISAVYADLYDNDQTVYGVVDLIKKHATIDLSEFNLSNLYGSLDITLNGITNKTETPAEPTNPTEPTKPTGEQQIHIYELNDKSLEQLVNKDLTFTSPKGEVTYNYTNYINQVYRLPVDYPTEITEPTNQIKTGLFNLTVDSVDTKEFKQDHFILDLGKIKVDKKYNNGFDTNVLSCNLYLPFISPIQVNIHDIIDKTLNIKYDVSLLDGTTLITVNNGISDIIEQQQKIITNLQLFSVYIDRKTGNLNTTIKNTINQAYLVITRNKPILDLTSYPTKEHGIIKNYTGFIKCANINNVISNTNDIENKEIKSLLESGVLINDITRN